MTTEQEPLSLSDLAHISSRNERRQSRPEDIGNLIADVRRLHEINENQRETATAIISLYQSGYFGSDVTHITSRKDSDAVACIRAAAAKVIARSKEDLGPTGS